MYCSNKYYFGCPYLCHHASFIPYFYSHSLIVSASVIIPVLLLHTMYYPGICAVFSGLVTAMSFETGCRNRHSAFAFLSTICIVFTTIYTCTFRFSLLLCQGNWRQTYNNLGVRVVYSNKYSAYYIVKRQNSVWFLITGSISSNLKHVRKVIRTTFCQMLRFSHQLPTSCFRLFLIGNEFQKLNEGTRCLIVIAIMYDAGTNINCIHYEFLIHNSLSVLHKYICFPFFRPS